MAATITVDGSKENMFAEGSGYEIVYSNKEIVLNDNTGNNFNHIKRQNNHIISLRFKNDNILKNLEYVTKEKAEEDLREISKGTKIVPYQDNKRSFILKKKNIQKRRIGEYDDKEETLKVFSSVYNDVGPLPISQVPEYVYKDNFVDYPYSFNYSNFWSKSGRIDGFGNVNKIKRDQTVIDDLKGFRSNCIGTSKSAFGENNTIKNHYVKNEDKTYHFEDNINNVYLYMDRDKTIIERIDLIVNPITEEITLNTTSAKKNIHSQETRYFAFKETKDPFREKSSDKNFWWIDNKQNIYKFTDIGINTHNLNNRGKNNSIKEDTIFSSCGKDIDKTTSSGRDSIAFHGEIN